MNTAHTDHFNVKAVEQTLRLATAFSDLLRGKIGSGEISFDAPVTKLTLRGRPKLGKSTFSRAITGSMFAGFEDVDITLGPSHPCPLRLFRERIYAWDEVYSPSANLRIQRIDRGACILAAALHGKVGMEEPPEDETGSNIIQLIEWPVPSDTSASSAVVGFKKVSDGRLIVLSTHPEIAESDEYGAFMENIGDLRAS
ncbi:MAG: hypothetical protein JKY71_02995 [Alphaproteobacteria bacterium]|nr:hypothetical protein [Alphaproteobacteria bacterium]